MRDTSCVVYFPTASWCRNLSYRSYRGDVDLFGVYCAGTEQVYLVPIADVPDKAASLRVVAPKNGQTRGVRWAKDYVIWPASARDAAASSGRGRGEDDMPVDHLRLIRGTP